MDLDHRRGSSGALSLNFRWGLLVIPCCAVSGLRFLENFRPTDLGEEAMHFQSPRRLAWAPLLAAILSLPLLLPSVPSVANAGSRTQAKRTILEFESRLRDENDKPVSGIFPMLFELKKPKAKRAFWSEKHWVAVDNGRYALQLGRSTRLPKGFDPKTAIMEVAIKGAGQVLREALAGASASLSEVVDAPTGKRIVQYAEKAGFAYDAEHATITDRIGAYNAKELKDTLEELKKRKVKLKVSRNRINLTSAGGVGSTKFEQICPPGTIAVGIRGGAGIYIDNLQVVCAPFE